MEEGPACGAVDLGWGSTLYRGVCVCVCVCVCVWGGGGFHPNLLCPPPLLSPSACVSVVSMTTRCLWRCSRRNRRVRERRVWRDGRLKCWGGGRNIGGNWQSEAFPALNITAQNIMSRPIKDARL